MEDPIVFKIKDHTFYIYNFLHLIYRITEYEQNGPWTTSCPFQFHEVENGRLDFAAGPVTYDRDYIELTNHLELYREALAKYKKLSVFI